MKHYDFTLRQIQYAVAVADTLSFRRAAERCHVSQPSLSTQIAEMESALGVRLFDRDRRRVVLTSAGAGLIQRLRQVLVDMEDVAEAARRSLDPLAGTLRIGVIPTIGPYLLPTVAPALHRTFPRLTLAWLEDKTEALVSAINHGDLDGAFLALEADLGHLAYERISEDPFLLATPKGHRLGQSTGPIRLNQLRREQILLLDEGHCFRDQVIEFCRRREIAELSFRATSLPTLVQMVSAGVGITLLPAIAVATETLRSNLTIRPIARPTPLRTIVLAWRPGSAVADAIGQIARTACEVTGEAQCNSPTLAARREGRAKRKARTRLSKVS